MIDICKYLRSTFYLKHTHTSDVVRDLKANLYTLFADFSFVDSSTLSKFVDSCVRFIGNLLN